MFAWMKFRPSLNMGRVELENRSLGQIIEEPIRVTKGFGIKSLLVYVIPHNPEGSGERFQGHHGPTPGPSWPYSRAIMDLLFNPFPHNDNF